MTISPSNSHIPTNSGMQGTSLSNDPPIQLEEVSSTDSVTKIKIPSEDIEKPTMALILKLAKDNGFKQEDITSIRVQGVSEKKEPIRDGYGVEKLDGNGKPIEIERPRVDTWEHKRGTYAQIPIRYDITLSDGQRTVKLQFEQPRYTNLKVPLNGTPRERALFEKKIQGLIVGIREEISGPIQEKDRSRISRLAQQTVSSFEFAYGSSNIWNGKRITWNPREQKETRVDRRDIIGVYPYADSAARRILDLFQDPILINDSHSRRPAIGTIDCPTLQDAEEKRQECEKKCLDVYAERHKKDGIASSTAINQNKSEVTRLLNELKIDPDTFIRTEARSAQEELLDIQSYFDEYLEFDTTSPEDIQVSLRKENNGKAYAYILELPKKIQEQKEKIEKLEKGSPLPEEDFAKLEDLMKSLLGKKPEDIVTKEEKNNPRLLGYCFSHIQSMKSQYQSALKKINIAILPGIRSIAGMVGQDIEALKKQKTEIEGKIEELNEQLEAQQRLSTLSGSKRELDRLTKLYDSTRERLRQHCTWLSSTLTQADQRLAAIHVLYGDKANRTEKITDKSIQELSDLREKIGYSSLHSKLKAYERFLTARVPSLDNTKNEEITLEEEDSSQPIDEIPSRAQSNRSSANTFTEVDLASDTPSRLKTSTQPLE